LSISITTSISSRGLGVRAFV